MLEGETLISTENIGFPISHLLDGGNVLRGFLSWNIWKMNILLQELTLLATMFVISSLPYQMSWKFLGRKYFEPFQTPPLCCRMMFGIHVSSYFSRFTMELFIQPVILSTKTSWKQVLLNCSRYSKRYLDTRHIMDLLFAIFRNNFFSNPN